MNNISPILIAFAAMAGYAIQPVLAKKMQLDMPPLAFIAATMFFLCGFALAASLYFEKDFSLFKLSGNMWVGIIVFAFVNFISFALFMAAVAKLPIAQYQLIGLLTPIVGSAFAYLLLKEDFKLQYLIGFGFIAIGLFIALRKNAG